MSRRVLLCIALLLSVATLVLYFSRGVSAFLPSKENFVDPGDSRTHDSITRTALLFIENDLFGVTEANITSEMRKANNEIVASNKSVDRPRQLGGTQFNKSASHFTGENFPGSMGRIADYKFKVRDSLNANDIKSARWHLGQALHTLQDFYAHSNWIERGGNSPWAALGDPSQIIRTRPPRDKKTCTNCRRTDCPDCVAPNSILPLTTNDLTTGYYGGDDIEKPKENPFKCSHGGRVKIDIFGIILAFRDESGLGFLSNGINKDADNCEISPRRDLHFPAAAVAYQATIQYLRDIHTLVGLQKMQKLLGFGRTMAFAIDTTGSMTHEMELVKQKVTQIVDARLGTALEPSMYVLSPFNDPQVGPVTVTDSATTFKNALNNLSANEGGDCPELAFRGMFDGVFHTDQSGDLIMFTDAGATENDRKSWMRGLILEAKRQKIKVHIVYSGEFDCPPESFYSDVTRDTGGSYFEVAPDEIDDVTVLTDFIVRPNTGLIFGVRGALTILPQTYTFRIDSFLTQASFVISGTGATNIVVRRPDGSIVQPTDIGVSYVPLSTGALYSFSSPTPGTWSITLTGSGSPMVMGAQSTKTTTSVDNGASKETIGQTIDSQNGNSKSRSKNRQASLSKTVQFDAANSSGEFSISVLGETKLQLASFDFLEVSSDGPHGGVFRTPGEPIAGQLSLVGAELSWADTVTPSFQFRSLDGSILQGFTLSEVDTTLEDPLMTNHARQFVGEVTVPNVPFQVYVTGTEASGTYQRVIPTVFTPVTLTISAVAMEDLYPGLTTTYRFRVKNSGPAGTFQVSASDDQQYLQWVLPEVFTLATNETKDLTAFLQVPANAVPNTLENVYLTAERTDGSGVSANAAFGPIRVGTVPVLQLGTVTPIPIGGDGDSIIEPGEGGSLTVQLTNTGASEATNTEARLTTSTPGVSISVDQSTYPDIAATNSAVNSTPFVFFLPSDAPCGQVISFTLAVTSSNDTSTSFYNFNVQTGQASPTSTNTVSYTGPVVAIPDNNPAGVNIPVNVTGMGGTITDLNFRIDGATCTPTVGATTVGIDHPFVSDLVLKLTSPGGTSITLIDTVDGSANNFCNTLLDDEGGGNSIQSVTSLDAPFSGTFRPAQPLNLFRGENPNGVWTLNVSDIAALDVGNVRAFSLIVSAVQISCNVAPSDTTPPSCTESAYNPGPPTSGEMTVQDSGIGLAAIHIVQADNVEVSVPSFTAGTTNPIIVTGTLIDPTIAGSFEIESIDVAGNVSSCSRAVPLPPPPCNTTGLIISEFRFRGSSGAADEFIEFYNKSGAPITVCTTDQSSGWALAARKANGTSASTRFIIPSGTIIPARGHYLAVNSSSNGYSLSSYPAGNGVGATGDVTYTTGIDDNSGIALFNTSNPANFTIANRLDAVGFSGQSGAIPDLYREGSGLAPIGNGSGQYTFVRNIPNGSGESPSDTNNNAADFLFLSTNAGVFGGVASKLGAPGPENLSSPITRGAFMPLLFLDATVAPTLEPNRAVDLTSDPANNSTLGTLSLRRRIVNNTGASVTRLRFRITTITTMPVPSGTADLRVRTSTPVTISNINDVNTCAALGTPPTAPCTVTVQGITLETPPGQSLGGGYNSTLSVTLPQPLAPGASVSLNFLLGVQQGGNFQFFVITEVLP